MLLYFSRVFHSVLHYVVFCGNAHLFLGTECGAVYKQWTMDMLGDGSYLQRQDL